ncbi:DUF3040 domain-containing protein [Actinoplanes rectilineatus]|uniref:DUF3040 domain-containing protein n=1 Tax=Actinoplanes rectilineatus TaxID=113571 RepID=UPI0005F2E585|nr:DUF3040 domain-containing protein [Actinoplanes rectilineatus]
MLSKEDSRRLAQMERQLQRDDPDFCTRMGGGNFSITAPTRPALPLFAVAAMITLAAAGLALVGWWIAAAITAAWSLVTLLAAAFRLRH